MHDSPVASRWFGMLFLSVAIGVAAFIAATMTMMAAVPG